MNEDNNKYNLTSFYVAVSTIDGREGIIFKTIKKEKGPMPERMMPLMCVNGDEIGIERIRSYMKEQLEKLNNSDNKEDYKPIGTVKIVKFTNREDIDLEEMK